MNAQGNRVDFARISFVVRRWAYAATALLAIASSGEASAAPEAQRAASKAPTEQGQGNRTATQEEAQASDAPLRVRIVEDEQQATSRRAREQETQSNQAENREAQHLATRTAQAQIVFGFLGTILLFMTLFYTARAANAAKSSADHARDALTHTVHAADAAIRNAEVAERALKISTEQFGISNRPLITLTPLMIPVRDAISVSPDGTETQVSKAAAIQIGFSNIGNTPAIKVTANWTYQVAEDESELLYAFDTIEAVEALIMAPGAKDHASQQFIDKALYDAVHDRRLPMLVKAQVYYTDNLTGNAYKTAMFFRVHLPGDFNQFFIGNAYAVRFEPLGMSVME